jgi:drug/metabolite transporter (DMT)-like permease
MSRRGAALFVLMSIVWGIPYLLIKVSVRHLTPAMVVEVRTAIGALVLLPLAFRRGEVRPLMSAWKPLLVYTVVELAIPWYLLSNAERQLSSSLSGLIVATVPLISVALAALMRHHDRLDRRGIGGLVVGLAGVAVLLGLDVHTGDLASVGQVLLVAVGYATGPLIVSRYLGELSSLALAAVSLALVAIVYLPVAVAQAPSRMPPYTAIVSLVLLGLVCTALAFVAFFELIKEVSPTRATIITYFNPVVAVALGVILLGEPLKAGMAVGFALILLGSWMSAPFRRSTAATPTAVLAEEQR